MDFKEQIAAYAAQIGIDKIGFAQATQTWQKDKYEEYLRLGYSCGFENQDIVKRYALSTDDFTAATIIAVADSFSTRIKRLSMSTRRAFVRRRSA